MLRASENCKIGLFVTQTSLKYSIIGPQKRKTNPSNAPRVRNNFHLLLYPGKILYRPES